MAVAIKELGYHNIKIYNGGIKDWVKSKLPIESIDPLPRHETRYIEATFFAEELKKLSLNGCRNSAGQPELIILDLRNEPAMSQATSEQEKIEREERLLALDSACPTVTKLFDTFLEKSVRDEIPQNIRVVTITETGNRDDQVQAFFSKYGYHNIESLKFGMRGWIKEHLPVIRIDKP